MKYILILFWISLPLLLTGCSTSSKVDKFLAEADEKIAAQQQLEQQYDSIITWDSQNTVNPLDTIGDSSSSDDTNGPSIRWYYKDYDETVFQSALGSGQKVVLFFFSQQDPSSIALEKDINTNISRIPDNTAILKIDIDTSSDLKTRYNVSDYNTIIILNPDGSEAKKTSGWLYKIDNLLVYL
jgi:proline dehydrogenase